MQKAQVLWNEYKYRHDLVWRVLFQVTAAAVILSVAPHLAPKDVVYYLRLWLLAAPVWGLFDMVLVMVLQRRSKWLNRIVVSAML